MKPKIRTTYGTRRVFLKILYKKIEKFIFSNSILDGLLFFDSRPPHFHTTLAAKSYREDQHFIRDTSTTKTIRTMAPKRGRTDETDETALVIDLDHKKKVSVRQFNGTKLVDIREFYEDKKTRVMKPGLKGVTLNEEAWKKLLECQEEITAAFTQLGSKRAKSDASESGKQSDVSSKSDDQSKTEEAETKKDD